MRLTIKYPLTIVAVALFATFVTGVVSYQISKKELRLTAGRQMTEILKSRKVALARYMKSIQQDLALVATSGFTHQALVEFTNAWPRLPGDPEKLLQKLYIHDNPYPIGRKEGLDQADDGSDYSAAHGRYHPWFRQLLEKRGYYDIFLFDAVGNLVYTVFKERDFATNLKDGRWRKTDLGSAFQTIASIKTPGIEIFFDFKPYEPSNGAPASFISTPVFDASEEFIGVLAFQMPIKRINEIMQVSAGMGKTGRAYLVGKDLFVRNDSRFSSVSEILKTKKSAEIVNDAMEGNSGTRETFNSNGTRMLVSYTPITFGGESWAIITEIELAEVLGPVEEMRRFLILAGLIIGAFVTFIGVWFAAGFSRPIVAMTRIMKRLAENDLDVEIPAKGRTDEIGDMEKTLAIFKENAVKRQQAETAVHESKDQLSTAIETIADGFMLTNIEGRIVLFNKKFRNLYPNSSDLISPGSKYGDFLRGGVERGEFPDALDHPDEWVHRQLVERLNPISIVETSLIGDRWVRIASRQSPLGGRVEIHVDITESKEAEAALRDREERVRAIVETILDGIITIDDTGQVETFNPAAERIFGYAADEVITNNVKMLMPSPFREEHDNYLKNYLTTGDAKVIGIGREVMGLHKNGQKFPMELSVSEMEVAGNCMFTGIVRDITERKKAEGKIEEQTRVMKEDLESAAQLQRSYLPDPKIECGPFTFRSTYIPSTYLSGDLFNVVDLDDGRYACYTLDVSGHGVPSALLSASLANILNRDFFNRCEKAATGVDQENVDAALIVSCLENLNRRFQISSRRSQYFTMAICILDISKQSVTFGSAGHPTPLLTTANEVKWIDKTEGVPVGFVDDPGYKTVTFPFEIGSRIFLYTDGVTECEDPAGKQWGEDNLRDLFAESVNQSMTDCLATLEETLKVWRGGSEFADDISVFSIERTRN